MANILSIETSSDEFSVAVHDQGKLLALSKVVEPRAAASQLSVEIDNGLRVAGITRKQLSAVAVSSGPGSYTGLRIGVSTAKGICYALDLPLLGVDTLRVLAEPAFERTGIDLICPMLDARRMEVYCCLLDSKGSVIEPSHPLVIDGNPFARYLSNRTICFVGKATVKCRAALEHPNASFAPDMELSASHMGKLAFDLYTAKKFEDLGAFEPSYLKEFIAKTKSQPHVL